MQNFRGGKIFSFLLSGFISLLIIFSLIFFMFIGFHFEKNDIEKYEEYLEKFFVAERIMPALSELDDATQIEVSYFYHFAVFAPYWSINLVVEYDEELYEQKKSELFSSYIFLENPIYEGKYAMMPQVKVKVNGFSISVIDLSEESRVNYRYPKYFDMIGYNDEEHKINYMQIQDTERDSISDLTTLIETSFRFP